MSMTRSRDLGISISGGNLGEIRVSAKYLHSLLAIRYLGATILAMEGTEMKKDVERDRFQPTL